MGGYSNNEKTVIYFVVNRFQIARMKSIVHSVDPTAFMTISEVARCLREGEGFLCIGIFMLVLCGYFVYTAITTKERLTKADIKFYWDILRKK